MSPAASSQSASGSNHSRSSPETSPFTDRASKRFHANLSKNRVVKKLRESDVLRPDDQVVAVAPLLKYPQSIGLLVWVGLLPGLIALFGFQRQCWVIVTRSDVVVTGFFSALRSALPKAERGLRLSRPVYFSLADQPRPSHFFGNKVTLPPEVATPLGRETLSALNGNLADYAFGLARTPSEMAPGTPSV
jgi:hypothetical protein